jgi:predicted Zn finger-like uncharacterized protein
MLTRCPSCATTFRITPEQLKARQGRVRCGQCRNVFDALETLVEEVTPIAAASEGAPREAPGDISAVEAVPLPPPAEAAVAALVPAVGSRVAPTFPAEPAAAESSEAHAPPPRESAAEPAEPKTLVDYEPTFDTLLADQPPRRAWPWAIGALLALTALALQAAYHYRGDLAVRLPEAKPALQVACELAGCDLPLPRKIELVAIDSSDLHPDPASAAQLQLVATLRNRAAFAQAYPHLELTLTDTTDKALLRRVLIPADYLPKAKPAAAGFAAGSDLAISLALEVRDLAPVGYRLYVFYP